MSHSSKTLVRGGLSSDDLNSKDCHLIQVKGLDSSKVRVGIIDQD
jgi:hypothetical protein